MTEALNRTPAMGVNKIKGIFLIAYVVLFFSLPLLVFHLFGSGQHTKFDFNPVPLQRIEKLKPRYILMGNSMLKTRINPTLLRRLSGEAKIFFLIKDGMMSAYWYLALKNYIASSGVKPEKVFIFFRDTFLTRPKINIAGKFKKSVDSAAHENEPLFQYIISGPKTLKEKIDYYLEQFYPVLKTNQANRDLLSTAAGVLAGFTRHHFKELLTAVNRRFNWDKIRYDGPRDERWWRQKPQHLDFEKNLPWSFLPGILRTARENHIRLVFVRVQTRPLKEGQPPPQSEGLKTYIAALHRYLKENGMAFYDFTGHPGLPLSKYGLTDHIANEYKNDYTRIFYEYLKEEFR
jgi:hypothetical protein